MKTLNFFVANYKNPTQTSGLQDSYFGYSFILPLHPISQSAVFDFMYPRVF